MKPLAFDEDPDEGDEELLEALLDSGAFTDAPEDRLTPMAALERQLAWESKAACKWRRPTFRVRRLVSYDLLIDETWVGATKVKKRWSLTRADWAVSETVAAATYLASQRERVAPRGLILSCQGVDPLQYEECTRAVLQVARPGDWLGLGGWCIIGRQQSLLPSFEDTLHLVLPMIRDAGLTHVHIFGVLWPVALGRLVWLADQVGLTVSTDSTSPLLSATRGDPKKAGMRGESWQQNLAYWRHLCAKLRETPYYQKPRQRAPVRQLAWEFDSKEGPIYESA